MSEPHSRLQRVFHALCSRNSTAYLLVVAMMIVSCSFLSLMDLTATAAETDTGLNGAQKVILRDGGGYTPCITKAETVQEFLDTMYLELGELDSISPDPETPLDEGDTITITRREYVTHKSVETVPYRTVYTHSPDLRANQEKVTVEGADGESELTYSRLVVDGEIVEETLVAETVIKPTTTKQVEMGFKVKPVSGLDFGAEFDEDGEPTEYVSVLRSQRSAAYTAGSGAKTASGLAAAVGHVAVNPNVIPYGSKLWIQASDGQGNYIYGYAIAADTGTSLMQDVIQVDLFYGSYQECVSHGIKWVDIFILE